MDPIPIKTEEDHCYPPPPASSRRRSRTSKSRSLAVGRTSKDPARSIAGILDLGFLRSSFSKSNRASIPPRMESVPLLLSKPRARLLISIRAAADAARLSSSFWGASGLDFD
ncbi:hypothetical protein RchiOBHm_Chr6g0253111 [Rosa chinensis]|uniref:Uncharacterized protein n=1 Tax=Rosa chinensis TaxID=74649 RepID=A0A2P6PL87_ROSCH|nr:hypothetical protein RchiOBHm_Chr6g0253111 [Rosa chinensis]